MEATGFLATLLSVEDAVPLRRGVDGIQHPIRAEAAVGIMKLAEGGYIKLFSR